MTEFLAAVPWWLLVMFGGVLATGLYYLLDLVTWVWRRVSGRDPWGRESKQISASELRVGQHLVRFRHKGRSVRLPLCPEIIEIGEAYDTNSIRQIVVHASEDLDRLHFYYLYGTDRVTIS